MTWQFVYLYIVKFSLNYEIDQIEIKYIFNDST